MLSFLKEKIGIMNKHGYDYTCYNQQYNIYKRSNSNKTLMRI